MMTVLVNYHQNIRRIMTLQIRRQPPTLITPSARLYIKDNKVNSKQSIGMLNEFITKRKITKTLHNKMKVMLTQVNNNNKHKTQLGWLVRLTRGDPLILKGAIAISIVLEH